MRNLVINETGPPGSSSVSKIPDSSQDVKRRQWSWSPAFFPEVSRGAIRRVPDFLGGSQSDSVGGPRVPPWMSTEEPHR